MPHRLAVNEDRGHGFADRVGSIQVTTVKPLAEFGLTGGFFLKSRNECSRAVGNDKVDQIRVLACHVERFFEGREINQINERLIARVDRLEAVDDVGDLTRLLTAQPTS